jgi:NADH-quinone oxidoreductase subunit H
VTTLFLGGWQIPPVTHNAVLRAVLEFVTFFVKAYFWVVFAMWLRATLPRVRVDQLMAVCWKYLVPISFVNVLAAALWVVVFPNGLPALRWVMFGVGLFIIWYFFRRVLFHLRRARVRERGDLLLSPLS